MVKIPKIGDAIFWFDKELFLRSGKIESLEIEGNAIVLLTKSKKFTTHDKYFFDRDEAVEFARQAILNLTKSCEILPSRS